MEKTFHVQDQETLRAIAHPLRQQILVELITHGTARAADLARRLDTPANSVSFHLRALAKAGMIVEAPEHARDRRDRVWAPVAEKYEVGAGAPGVAVLIDAAIAMLRENVARGPQADGGESDDGPKRSTTYSTLKLTRDQAAALSDEINDVLRRWTEAATKGFREDPDQKGADIYRVIYALGPIGGADPEQAPDEAAEA